MFRSVFIKEKNIDETWFRLLMEVYDKGREYKITDGSFAGAKRLEFDFVAGTITKPIQYSESGVRLPLAVTVPQGVPAPTTDQDIEDYFTTYLMNSELIPNEHYKYATWLVGGIYHIPLLEYNAKGIWDCQRNIPVSVPNQIDWCINHFKTKGYGNNHCCITIGYPESNFAYDVKYSTEMERGTSPCLRVIDLKIVNDYYDNHYLLMNCYFRSWDLYGGFPVNMGGLALLQEYIAGELGIEVGSLSFCSKGLHAYDFQIEALKARIGK